MIDYFLEFCDAEDVSAAAGSEVIAKAVDLGAAGVDPNCGRNMFLVISVNTTFTSGGAATVQFKLVSDSTDPASSDGSETAHWQSDVFGYASLVAGRMIIVPLPQGFPEYERYLQLIVTTATATTTAGKIDAYLTFDPPNWKAYPEAVS